MGLLGLLGQNFQQFFFSLLSFDVVRLIDFFANYGIYQHFVNIAAIWGAKLQICYFLKLITQVCRAQQTEKGKLQVIPRKLYFLLVWVSGLATSAILRKIKVCP